MIEYVIGALLIAALGARYLDTDTDKRHNMFCLGVCTHVDEDHADPDDPNEPAPEGASTGEVK